MENNPGIIFGKMLIKQAFMGGMASGPTPTQLVRKAPIGKKGKKLKKEAALEYIKTAVEKQKTYPISRALTSPEGKAAISGMVVGMPLGYIFGKTPKAALKTGLLLGGTSATVQGIGRLGRFVSNRAKKGIENLKSNK